GAGAVRGSGDDHAPGLAVLAGADLPVPRGPAGTEGKRRLSRGRGSGRGAGEDRLRVPLRAAPGACRRGVTPVAPLRCGRYRAASGNSAPRAGVDGRRDAGPGSGEWSNCRAGSAATTWMATRCRRVRGWTRGWPRAGTWTA